MEQSHRAVARSAAAHRVADRALPFPSMWATVAGSPALLATGLLIAGAWLAAVLLQVTGHAAALHHHALIEAEPGGAAPPPLWLGIPLFLLAWQLMIGSMMLPASLRAVRVVVSSRLVARPVAALAGFLGAYSVAWTAFGLAAFVGDMGLHRLVDATPWLAARPWLIQAGVLGLAGLYQLLPIRRRALEACRHPRTEALTPSSGSRVRAAAELRSRDVDIGAPVTAVLGSRDADIGFRIGLAHALDCLVCSWALMLLMFAAGFANLAWMAILAAVMAYEALGRHGARFGRAFGIVLLGLAVVAASGVVLGF